MKSPIIPHALNLTNAARLTNFASYLVVASLFLLTELAYSDDGAWLANPVDNNWSNPANWSSGTVPNFEGTAFFAASTITNIEVPPNTAVGNIIFQANAAAFTLTALPGLAVEIELGLENDSSVEQNFVAAAAGSDTVGFTCFQPTISGPIKFTLQATDVPPDYPPAVTFEIAGAGDATLHNLGASVPGGVGGQTNFFYLGTSAEEATVINDGAIVAGAAGGVTLFSFNKPSAGNATLIANSGSNGGGGGTITFADASLGDTARLEVFGNGYMDMSAHSGPSLSIGSIEGDGQIYLGKATLIVGSNSLSTTFSGVLHPGDPSGGSGTGFLSKMGTGSLSLTGANLYTGRTTLTQGSLVVSNRAGSGTGTGAVSINAGTLGGSGVIAGAVTIGTGSGTGAFLTPGIGTNKQVTLTIQSALTFNSDATYTYTFKGNKSRGQTDKVIANGVTINGGTIAISSSSQNQIRRGTVLTVISNTSANPISGTFANLPDGAIVTVNGNNLQASYSGGDGNDLTLTVVP